MKKLFFVSSVIMFSGSVMCQAVDGTLQLQKMVNANEAVMIVLPYRSTFVKEAFNDYLSKTGLTQQKNAYGYLLPDNTSLAKNNTNSADMVFKFAESKSIQN